MPAQPGKMGAKPEAGHGHAGEKRSAYDLELVGDAAAFMTLASSDDLQKALVAGAGSQKLLPLHAAVDCH